MAPWCWVTRVNRVNNMALIAPLFLFFLADFFFFLGFFFFPFLSLRFCLIVIGAVGSVGVGCSVTSPLGSLVAGSGIALTAGEAIASVEARITAKTRIPGLFLSVAMAHPLRPEAQTCMECRREGAKYVPLGRASIGLTG